MDERKRGDVVTERINPKQSKRLWDIGKNQNKIKKKAKNRGISIKTKLNINTTVKITKGKIECDVIWQRGQKLIKMNRICENKSNDLFHS